MVFSIVTVVFNAVSTIEQTILSVVNQTFKDIQYIIIDGGSTDGTLDIIEKYRQHIDVFVSEPDKGLYDAMNKSLKYIIGDFVCFLNSGDTFCDEKTLENVSLQIKDKECDIIYGDTLVIDEQGNIKGKRRHRPPKQLNWKSFRNGMLVCHQAFWVSSKIIEPYNLNYRYSSDFDWCIRMMKKTNQIHNSEQTLIKFLDGGLTKKRLKQSLKERFKIMTINYGWLWTIWVHVRNAFKMSFFYLQKGWF